MIVASHPARGPLRQAIVADGFVFVRGPVMQRLLTEMHPLSDEDAFAPSWNDLRLDTYMADGGRYRRRRFAVYSADGASIVREPHQPHYQSRDYNALNGGVERWFDPIERSIGDGPTMRAILGLCRGLFAELAPETRRWRVEVHQFRIEARPGERGLPTPEGIHRDGVDYALVLLIARQNIAEGETTIHSPDGRRLGSFTLTEPFDGAIVDDHLVAHDVTPVKALDPAAPAWRDVLVVTFRSVGLD